MASRTRSRPPAPHASPLGAIPGAFVNLSHRLHYVRSGYLASMDAELQGVPALPATRDLLDAFHPVIFHARAKAHGLPMADLQVIEDPHELRWPVRLVAAHPYTSETRDVQTETGAQRAWPTVSMGGVQPVCQYGIEGKPFEVRSVLGMTLAAGKEELAWGVWELFHLPLVRIHGFQTDADVRLTHLEQLRLADLTERDLHLLSEVSERPFSAYSWTR